MPNEDTQDQDPFSGGPLDLRTAALKLDALTADEDPSTGSSESTPESDTDQTTEQDSGQDLSPEDAELAELAALDDNADDGEAEDPSSDESTVDLFEIPDGEGTKKVPRDELVAGYMRRSDYDRKRGEEAAATREAVAQADQARAEAVKVRDQYASALEKFESRLAELDQEPDWKALKEQDPNQYLIARDEWAQRQRAREKLQAERDALQAQEVKEREAQQQSYLVDQERQLREFFPEIVDPVKRKTFTDRFYNDALAFYGPMGLVEDNLNQLDSALLTLIVHDALQHRRTQRIRDQRKVEIAKKKKNAPTVKQGAPKTPKTGKARQVEAATKQLRQTRSMRDAVEYLNQTLGNPD